MVKNTIIIICLVSVFFGCTPKGPQTFDSGYIGKSENHLLITKGKPQKVKVFPESKAYIYTVKEDYFGKNQKNIDPAAKPKKQFVIEYIYYINQKGTIYKYQVWRKKANK